MRHNPPGGHLRYSADTGAKVSAVYRNESPLLNWGLRDYGVDGQLGLEKTPEAYVSNLVSIFHELRKVLRDDGTVFLNLGDSYTSGDRAIYRSGVSDNKGQQVQDDMPRPKTPPGLKPKDLCGIPWRVAFALQADGWWLRQDIVWSKPNPMPESVTDRCTKSHEYIFLLSKSARYYYDNQAIMEHAQYGEEHANKATSWGTNRKHPNKANVADYAFKGDNHTTSKMEDGSYGRNKRSVWTVSTQPYPCAHFATFPPDLIRPCILAGTSEKGCCPSCGKPWVRVVDKDKPLDCGRIEQERNLGQQQRKSLPTALRGDNGAGWASPESKTIGWQPQCSCGGSPIPCTVLDPFAGSGTTGEVAKYEGRKAVLVELKKDYCEMARKRIQKTPCRMQL